MEGCIPEQQNIERKESWRYEYLKWICGFANAQGGKLYIICDDSGKVVGVNNSKKLLEDIPNKIRDAMGIVIDVNRLTFIEFAETTITVYKEEQLLVRYAAPMAVNQPGNLIISAYDPQIEADALRVCS